MTTPPVTFILAADYIERERAREAAETDPDGCGVAS